MCVNKIYIKNNKLDFNPAIDRFYNYVPCGQCEECLYQQSLQYENRCIAEFESNRDKGGVSFYYTLTYNDVHIPKFKGVNVFSKNDIQLYHKRLRKFLKQHGFSDGIRYFLSSEYGHQSLRPHYHVIYFVPYYIDSLLFKQAVNSSWQKGFIYPGNNLGVISDVRPCHYVAKYVQKDSFALAEFDKKGLSASDYKEYKTNKETLYKNINLLPFHLQSQCFGLSLISHITDSDLIRGYYVKTNSLGISMKCPVPFYIQRKMMYEPYINSNGNTSFCITNYGISIFKQRAFLNYNHTLDNFDNLLLYIKANYKFLNVPSQIFSSYEKFCTFADKFPGSKLSQKLATYSILYRSNFFVPFKFTTFLDDLDVYCNYLTDFYFMKDTPDLDVTYDNFYNNLNVTFFDSLIGMFEEANCKLKFTKYLERVNLYNIDQQFKSFRTKKLKLIKPKKFDEFVNLKSSHLCLNILLSTKFKDVA